MQCAHARTGTHTHSIHLRACLGASAGRVQCLRNTRNFHSLMAVLAGLSMAAVSRLKFTSNNLGSRINKVTFVQRVATLFARCH